MSLPSDPVPRGTPFEISSVDWPVHRSIPLGTIIPPPATEFAAIISGRKSTRSLRRASLREVTNFIEFASETRSSWGDRSERTSRPSHSAGALHPISILLVSGRPASRVFRFDANAIVLQSLRIYDRRPLALLDEKIRGMFPESESDFIVLLADRSLVDAHYSNPDTLVWRDAGALMQTLHMCAFAYRLGFCPAGITGWELPQALFGSEPKMLGVGAAIVGRFLDV